MPAAAPRDDPHSLERLASIGGAIKRYSYNVLFLGDSLTERWSSAAWNQYLVPFAAINAGVDGDRTEHLLWRIDHGGIAQKPPKVIVLLIGTNDLGHGRSPVIAAEGVRIDLTRLRERAPQSKILLLGLLPRSDRFGREIAGVNHLISTCNGGAVVYANVGSQFGTTPSKTVLTDGVHLTDLGYDKISKYIKIILSSLIASSS